MGPFKMSRTILISLFLREGTCLYRSCVLVLIADDSEFEDVTDDEMKLIDAKYDEHAKALLEKAWKLVEAK